MFVGVIFHLIAAGEPHFTLIVITGDFLLGGIGAVMEVENELDDGGAAQDAD